jgi:hypothetical protein
MPKVSKSAKFASKAAVAKPNKGAPLLLAIKAARLRP